MHKITILLCAVLLAVLSVTGCHSMGKAAGEAVEEIEEGADRFEEGYERGREN